MRTLTGLLVEGFPFYGEGLADVGKIEVAPLRAAVVQIFRVSMRLWSGGVDLDEIRFRSILEESFDILKEGGWCPSR